MRHHILSLFTAVAAMFAVAFVATSCQSSDSDVSVPIPKAINQFVSRYFPGQGVSSFSQTSTGGYQLKLASSASITFSQSQEWEKVDGCGGTLPEIFLFDQLPPALYEYLQELESVNAVYSVSRDTKTYTVDLLNTIVVYDISSGDISMR